MRKKVSFNSFPLLKGIKNEKEVDRFVDKSIRVYQALRPAPTRLFMEKINSKEFRENVKFFFNQHIEIDYHTESYEKAVMDSNSCIIDTLMKNSKNSNDISEFSKFLNICSSKKIEEDDVEILESAINLLGGKRKFGILIGKHEIDKKQLKDYFIYDLSLYEGKPRLDIIRVDEVIDPFDNKPYEVIEYVLSASKLFYNKKTEITKLLGSNLSVYKENESPMANDACWVLKLLIFKEIAETEVEYIDVVNTSRIPKNISNFQKQNYINNLEGDITINYYSANWYTEIIRDEEFGVRGHWRNQPYKDGYKLIFIKPFKKHGYHRKAEKDQVVFKERED